MAHSSHRPPLTAGDRWTSVLVEFGLGVLIGALAYWSVYSFDYYSCFWIGTALAAAIDLQRMKERDNTR